MSNITISFDNDDRTIEVSEDTIKKVPFLQSYYNFNNSVDKPNIIRLENYSYEDCEYVLNIAENKNISLLSLIKCDLENRLNTLNFFGIISKDLADLYIMTIYDCFEKFSTNSLAKHFIDNKDIKIISLSKDQFNKFQPIMNYHKNIIPYYKFDNNIFLGHIPFPIKINKIVNGFSINDIIKNNYDMIKDSNGRINKTLFTYFSLFFGLGKSSILFVKFDCQNFSSMFEFLINHNRFYDNKEKQVSHKEKQLCEYVLKKYKLFANYFVFDNKDLYKDEDNLIKFYQDNFTNLDLDMDRDLYSFILKYKGIFDYYYFNQQEIKSFFMTEEEFNIMNNKDKYIAMIEKESENYGFIKID